MRTLLNNFRNDAGGLAALEFAFAIPVMLLLAGGITEIGRALYQSQALDKAIRAGAAYSAHVAEPFSAASKTLATNIVKTGNPDGTGAYTVPGLASPLAKVEITPLSYDLNGTPLQVIRVSVEVPYDPIFPVITGMFDSSSLNLRLSHEQAYIGS